MLGAYASVALVCAGSLVVGQAILFLCGRRDWTWLSGPVGLAALLVASGLAVKLPGHGTAVAITVGVMLAAAAVLLVVRRGSMEGAPGGVAVGAAVAGALALVVASIPFIVNQRIGILGVGLVNDDMAYHLLIADWLNTRVGDMPVLIHQGYPVGPHSLVAGLSEGLGTGLVEAFAGLTLAIPVLTALVAFEALRYVRPAARVVAAVLVAIPYLVAAYLAQEAFKEPIEALFLLSFALLLPTVTSPLRAVPLGVIAAGATYTYSFPGLFWLAAAAVIYALIVAVAPRWRPQAPRSPALLTVAVGLGVLALLTAPEWTRMIDFGGFRAFGTSNLSGGLGNLRHQLSPLEALGIWPTSEFRLAASDSSHPAAFYLGGLIALAALAVGLPRWLRRYGPAVPAALAAAILGYLGALLFGTVYTSAKALSIAAPMVALVAVGGLLSADRHERRGWVMPALAAVLAVAMALSSFLVLRQTPVAPTDHADQLAELRPLVQGQKVLFLGRDNFVAYELRGARPFTAVRNYYDPNYVKPDLRLRDVFRKFDFDSVTPATLSRFPYVITTRAAYASGPPPNFEPVRRTRGLRVVEADGPGRAAAHPAGGRQSRRLSRVFVPGGDEVPSEGERDGLRQAAGGGRQLVAELDRGGRVYGHADAGSPPGALGDLAAVRRDPAAARLPPPGSRRRCPPTWTTGARSRTTRWASSRSTRAARSGSPSRRTARPHSAACSARRPRPTWARSQPVRRAPWGRFQARPSEWSRSGTPAAITSTGICQPPPTEPNISLA